MLVKLILEGNQKVQQISSNLKQTLFLNNLYNYFMRNRQYDHLFKFVIVGNSSVGKSCLLLRFADDQFNENYMTTIGVDFRFKTLTLDQKNIKLQIWDTAGQERFRTITNTYYKNANAVFLVYDITNLESYQDIQKYWLNEVESYADSGTHLVLVGNKCDLLEKRVVTVQMAQQFAKRKNMKFFETSAKTATQVHEGFSQIARILYDKVNKSKELKKQDGKSVENNSQRLNPEIIIKKKSNSLCC